MTITLSWWAFPAVLVLVAAVMFARGSRRPGMFGGMGHALLGCALVLVAGAFSVGYQSAGWV
jgi:hypothetical protein